VPRVVEHPLEPFAVAASLDADDHFAGQVRVKLTDLIKRVVKQALFFNLTIL